MINLIGGWQCCRISFSFCFYVSKKYITDADDVSHSNSTASRVENEQNEFFLYLIDYSLWNQPFLFSCCMSPFSSQWTTFLKMFLILWTLITRLRRRLSFSIRRIPLWPSVSSSSACVCPTIFCITWPLIFAWREKYGFLKMKGLYWSLLIFILLFRSIDSHRGPQLEVNPQQFHTGYIIY